MQFDVFGIPVAPWLFAVAVFGYLAWEVGKLWFALNSGLWPHVRGQVVEAEIENKPDSDGDDFFVPRVRYRYRAQGRIYDGSRLSFHPKGSYRYEDVVRALAGVSAGEEHRVYYDPRRPRFSVLKPGASAWNYVLIGLLFVIGLVAVWAEIHRELRI